MADAVSHDQNFKNLIVDYPREALAFFAAEEAPGPEDDVHIAPVPVGAGLVPARARPAGVCETGGDEPRPYELDARASRPRSGAGSDLPSHRRARAERWLDSDNVVARVNLPNMHVTGHDRVEVYARAVSGLLEQETDGAKRAKYLDFIDIYAGLTDNELRRYRRLHPEEGSIVTGFFQRAREEGRAEGIERGIERRVRLLALKGAET
ncbi:MAG: hypothetical protein F4X36_11920 [Gammaproteobacteria bacterium]|nr:hypothetical protein [Gammaproteobacteria bacterium]